MSTKRQKRITRQVRISWNILQAMKFLAIEKEMTISKLIDEILLENVELRNLVSLKNNDKEKPSKRIGKIIRKENKKEVAAFNKITF